MKEVKEYYRIYTADNLGIISSKHQLLVLSLEIVWLSHSYHHICL